MVFILQVQVTSTQISPQLAAAVQQASEQQIQVQVRLLSVLQACTCHYSNLSDMA